MNANPAKLALLGLIAACIASPAPALAQTDPFAEKVEALKASLAASQAALRQYEWIETTVISVKGDEKSREQNRCYYGAEGGVQKVPLTEPEPEKKAHGLRGRIVERKKEELSDYMLEAVAMVKSYVPPSEAQVQAAMDAGRVSMDILEPGKRVRLNIRGYAKPGDTLGVEMDMANNRLLGLSVKTYLEKPDDTVSLEANLGSLADGTTYTAATTLVAPAKNLKVTVENSGYRKTGS
ncbi:MAG: hypothetical protein AB1714_17330 [Acidobacteriota bacterium]